jgi:hypothetical protein
LVLDTFHDRRDFILKSSTNISKGVNDENLSIITSILDGVPHIPFYGTLLGLVREGVTIPGDDDVDLIIQLVHRNRVLALFQEAGLNVNLDIWPNNVSNCFFQIELNNKFGSGFIDIYFVESWVTPHSKGTAYKTFPLAGRPYHAFNKWKIFANLYLRILRFIYTR